MFLKYAGFNFLVFFAPRTRCISIFERVTVETKMSLLLWLIIDELRKLYVKKYSRGFIAKFVCSIF